MLQKFQRNYIFKAIQEVGLDPGQFDLAYSESEVRIKHRLSESYYFIGGRPGDYAVKSLVGDGGERPHQFYSWEPLISHISLWLQVLKKDLNTPDLWAELQREAVLLGAGSDELTENTPFTLDEQKEIAGRCQELATYARHTYSLSPTQMQVLDAKLDYLVKASGRLGRIDWRNAFVGAMLGFILAAALPPESARDILLTLLRAIGGLYPELPNV
jgi:hypothetical protein